jgi:hypothetical protein
MKQEIAEIGAMRAGLAGGAGRPGRRCFSAPPAPSLDDLRARAAEPEFLASVLDFILMDDAWVVDCATALGWRPSRWSNAPGAARRRVAELDVITGNPRDGGLSRFAGIQRRQQALQLQRFGRAELGVEMIHVLDTERARRHKARLAFLGQRHGRGAPVLAPHLARDQAVVLQLPQRAGGGGAVDADELRDLGGVLQALFLDAPEGCTSPRASGHRRGDHFRLAARWFARCG